MHVARAVDSCRWGLIIVVVGRLTLHLPVWSLMINGLSVLKLTRQMLVTADYRLLLIAVVCCVGQRVLSFTDVVQSFALLLVLKALSYIHSYWHKPYITVNHRP